jgi:DNA polymerase-3 subunit beta
MIADKASLHSALKAVLPVAKGSKTTPILNHVMLARIDNELVIRGSNLDQEVNVAIKVEFDQDFEDVAVPAYSLAQFVDSAPSSEIMLTLVRDDRHIIRSISLASGRSRLRLLTLPASDFPALDSGPLEAGFTIDGQIFSKALKAVISAACIEMTRDYLRGAFVEPTPEGLILVATDGHRVERRFIPSVAFDDGALMNLPAVIFPTDGVSRLLGMIVEGRDLTLQISDHKFRATVGNVTLLSKLTDGTFPDYRRVIPQRGQHRAIVSAAALSAAIKRVEVASDEKIKAVRLEFTPGELTLSVRDDGLGDASDQIEADGGAQITTAFNGKYLSDMIASAGADKIEMCFSDPGSPALMNPVGDEESLCVLMPMRL